MRITHPYIVPEDPADPEIAALELVVALPCELFGAEHLRAAFQELATLLDAAETFAGLSWLDAKQVAAAVAFDLYTREDAPAFLSARATNVRNGCSGSPWDSPELAARALDAAARVANL